MKGHLIFQWYQSFGKNRATWNWRQIHTAVRIFKQRMESIDLDAVASAL
jgi:hypothetical protein